VLSSGVYELTNFDLNNHFDDKMILIEKYNPKKVYSVIHLDGKSKNYMVKRFMFENVALGKQVSIISEEPGSKLILMAKEAPLVRVMQLKGKEQTPETIEVNLAELIDVKGMKAMGNRLSQFPVKTVELIAESESEEPTDTTPETEPDDETGTDGPEDQLPGEEPESPEPPKPKPAAQPKAEPVKVQDKPEASKPEPVGSSAAEPVRSEDEPVKPEDQPKEHKKVDFEITNPDDIEIDDKGQLGLF
jgi:topoisomerase-4 subunit A